MLYGSICLVAYYKITLIMQIQHIRINPQQLHIKNAQSNWLFDTSKTILSFKTLAMFCKEKSWYLSATSIKLFNINVIPFWTFSSLPSAE